MSRSPAEEFRRADAVFDAALDLEGEARAAFIASACATDPSLRDAVERLLRAHDRIDGFLDVPPVGGPGAAPMPARLGPYRILRELGHGGMGVVYLAEPDASVPDEPLRETARVALKVVRSGPLAAGSMVRRFLAERRILASLVHPNVARLLDAGVTADGTPYFAMEYCAGGSLAERLAAHGALTLPEAIGVARQLAAALGAAHARGVVHRDVKPGNVLFDADGRVRLGDFGIAKILGQDSTRSGAVLGTAAYLAPEQLDGRPVDHRTDLWALGVTLHEMISGRRPFVGDTYAAVLHAVLATEPPPLASGDGPIPEALRALVGHLLSKDPAARPQSAADVERILSASGDDAMPGARVAGGARRAAGMPRGRGARVAAVAVALAALALGGYAVARPGAVPTSGRDAGPGARGASVAVWPFTSPSDETAAAPLADGLTNQLIGALGEIEGLSVAGRNSIDALRRRSPDARGVARMLGVATVLDGSVRRTRDRVRITARLVSAADGATLWARTYESDPRDVVAVREEIARRVAGALHVRLTSRETARLARRETRDPEAYDLYTQGRFNWTMRTRDGLERALGYFQQAVERDPSYALAYMGTADAYVNLTDFGFAAGADVLPRARAAAERAVALDPASAEAYAALGHVLESQLEYGPAEAAFRRAIALNPRYVWGHHYYALLLAMQGRVRESRDETSRVLALDPLSAPANTHLGVLSSLDGDLEAARRQLETTAAITPSFPLLLYYLGVVYAAEHRYADAIRVLESARRQADRFPGVLAALAYAYRETGRPAAADSALADLRARQRDARGRANVALAHGVLGETDAAFRRLQDVQWDIPSLIELRANPLLARLRADARYRALLRSAGVAP